ncbi:hypothetical protein [Algibacillus agarilyticus]|uniref:hypothetical protein n=1 Tax=Algibacillus agarilyticus TaxID=2234133 RepID=UPI000DD03C01|nr:hypothetical protein [Algibacillus agarilyticus]
MKKGNAYTSLTVIGVLIGILLYGLNTPSDTTILVDNVIDDLTPVAAPDYQNEPEVAELKVQPFNTAEQDRYKRIKEQDAKIEPILSFEDDWCFRSELTKDDIQYAKFQKNEWDLARGSLNFSTRKNSRSKNFTDNDALALSYKVMNKADLITSAKSGDVIAKIALLKRRGLSRKTKINLAHHLLVEGKTGNALVFLVAQKVGPLNRVIRSGREFTEKHKSALMNALVYANFGLERYDDSALLALMAPTKQNQTLKLLSMLTPEDMETVELRLQKFKSRIDEKRLEKGYPPISDIEIPKIAKHDFEWNMGFWFNEAGEEMRLYRDLNASHIEQLTESECTKRVSEQLKKTEEDNAHVEVD